MFLIKAIFDILLVVEFPLFKQYIVLFYHLSFLS
jgi:hypothetical protein